jgi:hypothetical protein
MAKSHGTTVFFLANYKVNYMVQHRRLQRTHTQCWIYYGLGPFKFNKSKTLGCVTVGHL